MYVSNEGILEISGCSFHKDFLCESFISRFFFYSRKSQKIRTNKTSTKKDVNFISHERGVREKSEFSVRIRTPAFPITGRMLYQLSYGEPVGEPGHMLGSYVTRVLHTASTVFKK